MKYRPCSSTVPYGTLRRKILSSSPATSIVTRAMCAVGGLNCFDQLDAVGLSSANHALLLLDRELVERPEFMHPAHGQDMTAALARLALWNERHVGGPADRLVRRAIHERGQTAPIAVPESGPPGAETSQRRPR